MSPEFTPVQDWDEAMEIINRQKRDTHRATFLAVITKEMFEAAKSLDWVVTTGYVG